MEDQPKIRWTIYIALTSLFLFVSVSEVGPFSSVKTIFMSMQTQPPQKYVIVFDGGSTGTRIHIFTFTANSNGVLTLKDEYFEEVKPGLSSFADDPPLASKSVIYLLEKAKTLIPAHKWNQTPVALKATAGLRLLPNAVSDSILNEVYQAFKNSPFYCSNDGVSILAGEDEGLFAWYTLNFLLGRLDNSNYSVASLDLGGGSTQITFSPADLETLISCPKDHIVISKVQNKTMTIYTHSYLGLGLMSTRLSILQLSSDHSVSIDTSNTTTLLSSCIPPHEKITWTHNLKDYTVMGKKNSDYGFKHCYNKAIKFLGKTVYRPEELKRREIYALSYYFDRAFDLGIVGKEGGIRTIDRFIKACQHACSKKNNKEAFLCLDCSYISALLLHGLGLDERKELKFAKQINGIETSWGLGAAFNMLL